MTVDPRERLSASLRLTATCALFLALPGQAASASPAPDRAAQERIVAGCIRNAADGRTWLEKTLWGLRDQEGGWIGAEIANSDGSHDLGPLQVNSRWVGRIAKLTGRQPADIRWWLTHDACFNVDTARWIFLSGVSVTRDYWQAVGVYHSPTGWRQRRYARSVASKLRMRFGAAIFHSREVVTNAPD